MRAMVNILVQVTSEVKFNKLVQSLSSEPEQQSGWAGNEEKFRQRGGNGNVTVKAIPNKNRPGIRITQLPPRTLLSHVTSNSSNRSVEALARVGHVTYKSSHVRVYSAAATCSHD